MKRWLRETTGGLPAAFWYLWTGSLINRLGSFVVIFMAIYLTTARDFSAAQAGLIIGLNGAGGAAGTMIGGVLADRWGRRPTLLLAHLGAASAMLSLGFVRGLLPIAAGALLLGLFAEAARPAFAAMMIDIVPERDRLRAFSLNYWAINLGFAFAAVLAGLAAQVDYLLLFAVDAGTTLLTATIVLVKIRETRPAGVGRRAATGGTGGGGLRTVFADRVFMTFVGLNLLLALIFLQHISNLPIAMSADGLSPAMYGLVIGLNGVLIVLGQLFVPRLIRGRDRSRTLALAAVVVGAGFGLTALADTAWLYAVTVLIWTAGEMLQSPSNSTLIAELTPLGLRGRYQGVFSLSWSGAAFLAPTLGGYVQERAGSAALWLGCAIVAGIAAIGHVLAGPARERRVAALRAATPPAATPPTATPPTATPPVPAESAGAAAATDLTPAGGVTSDTLVSPGRHTYRRVDH